MIEELSEEILKRLYVTEQRSTTEIAKIFRCSSRTIRIRCKKYGIKLRPKGRRIKELDKSVLQKLYVKEGKQTKKIAEIFSCSPGTVRNRCLRYGIALRRPQELNRAVLHKLYIEEGKTIREIAEILGCSREAVRIRCKQFGIELRSRNRKFEVGESTPHREGKPHVRVWEGFHNDKTFRKGVRVMNSTRQ